MTSPAPTCRDLLQIATAQLSAAGVDGAARDARLLLAHTMGLSMGRLSVELARPATPGEHDRFLIKIAERSGGKPVSHILGYKAFWTGEFEVSADTLAPRPETETLIEQALMGCCLTILDLGTGTGCIAVSLLMERPEARATASDLSAAALAVAGRNGAKHGVTDRLTLVQSNWFDGISGRFDLIVSNPPYIAADDVPGLAREVRDHDPLLALSDGADGLTCYRTLTAQARDYLHPGGRLMVEIGATQRAAVQMLFDDAGFTQITCTADLDGRDRVIAGIAR